MKRLLLIFFTLILASGTAVAVEQTVTIDPLGLALGVYNIQYERTISEGTTLSIRASYRDADRKLRPPTVLQSFDKNGWAWKAFGLGGSYRSYISDTAPAGVYWGAGIDFLYVDAEYSGKNSQSVFGAPQGEAGYNWITNNGMVLGIYMNMGYLIGNLDVSSTDIPKVGPFVGGGLKVGWGW
jgi:hypothetical protein